MFSAISRGLVFDDKESVGVSSSRPTERDRLTDCIVLMSESQWRAAAVSPTSSVIHKTLLLRRAFEGSNGIIFGINKALS